MKSLGKITEGTLIPISLVIAIIGGIFWLTGIYYQGVANASAVSALKSHVEARDQQVKSDLSDGFSEIKREMAEDRKVTTRILFELQRRK